MEDAKLYSKTNSLQITAARNIIREFPFMADWKNCDKLQLLDIGCGTGDALVKVILPLIPGYSNVVAIDILEEMIRAASLEYGSIPGLTFKVFNIATENMCTLERLGKFSHITSFFCLHWIKDQRQLFKNICQLLLPGGQLFAIIVRDADYAPVYEELSRNPKWAPFMKDWKNYPSEFTYESDWERLLGQLLIEAGFEQFQIGQSLQKYQFLVQNQLRDTLQSINPFIHRMPAGLKDKFMDELMTVYLRHIPRLELGYETIVLYASKPTELN